MSDSVKVTKLVIKIGDDKLELDPAAAKELLQVLQDLLGEKETKYIPYPVDRPYPVYPHPYRYWYYGTTGEPGTVSVSYTNSSTNVPLQK